MNDKFADWYRPATAGMDTSLTSALLDARWKATDALLPTLKQGNELDLVRLLLGLSPKHTEFAEAFRRPFKDADSTFAMTGNDFELTVLSGCAIGTLISAGPSNEADNVALALISRCDLLPISDERWIAMQVSEARTYLHHRSQTLRNLKPISPIKFNTTPIATAITSFAESIAANDFPGRSGPALKTALDALQNAATKTFTSIEKALSTTSEQLALRKEESDILWWMASAYSHDLDKPYAEVKMPAASLIAARDLARLVIAPGPLSAKAFLTQVLSACGPRSNSKKTFSISAAINAAPREWRESLAGAGIEDIEDFAPILGGVRCSLTTKGATEWIPVFDNMFGFPANTELDSVALGLQVYRECLLLSEMASK